VNSGIYNGPWDEHQEDGKNQTGSIPNLTLLRIPLFLQGQTIFFPNSVPYGSCDVKIQNTEFFV
jgi:hypothetical protein